MAKEEKITVRVYKDYTFEKKNLPVIEKTDTQYCIMATKYAEMLLERDIADRDVTDFSSQIMDKKAWIACEVAKEIEEMVNKVRQDIIDRCTLHWNSCEELINKYETIIKNNKSYDKNKEGTLPEIAKNIQDVSIFISVTRKDNEISTFTDIRTVDITDNADIKCAVANVITDVMLKKYWIGGMIDKITVIPIYSCNSGFYVKPEDFNYLLKL